MRKALAALSAALCAAAGGSAIALPASAQGSPRASVGNPMAGDHGFGTVVEQDALLGSTETEGTVAVGGDLTFGPGYNVMLHPTGGTYYAPGESEPTALLIGGRIAMSDSAGQGVLRVANQGHVHVQNTTGITTLDRGIGTAAGNTEIVESGAVHDSTPRVQLTLRQAPSTLRLAASPIDFGALFAHYRQRALEIAATPANVTLTDAAGATLPDQTGFPAGTQAYVTLTPGETNVLHLTGQDVDNLAELSFRTAPSADTPFVVVVDPAEGAYSWHVPNLAGVDGQQAPYMLWDFPTATDITLASGDGLEGTIYAPDAHLTDVDPSDVEGDIAVKSLQAGPVNPAGEYTDAGEIHDFPFNAELDYSNGASSAPTSTAASTTPPSSTASSTKVRPESGGGPAGTSSRSRPGGVGIGAAGNGRGGGTLPPTGMGHGRLTAFALGGTAVLFAGAALTVGLHRRRRRSL